MNPSDSTFLIFLALVLPIHTLLARRGGTLPVLFLLLAGLAFYASWNPLYLLPLALTAATDYAVGRGLARFRSGGVRRTLLGLSLLVDLSLLASFKYWDLLAAGWGRLAPQAPQPHFRILFVMGISYYTFQSLGYVIDVYRREIEAERSFWRYFTFVSFFPTILMGPITRAETLLPQLNREIRPMDPATAGRAFFLIALGFLKKRIIADYLAVQLVNRVFEQPLFFSSLELLSGVYAYAVQLYCDFSGYSDIVIGSALLLGFRLKDNFRWPYRAQNLVEFWKRWHISFSSWLENYVFFSLPGIRKKVGAMAAIFVTFVLGGLWHGASWCFLAWGLIHGAGLAAVHLFRMLTRGPRRQVPVWRRAIYTFLTFHVVLAAWVFFRAESLEQAGQVFRRLSDLSLGSGNVPWPALAAITGVLALQWFPEKAFERVQERFAALPVPAQALLLLGAAALVSLAAGTQLVPFVYQAF